LRVRSIGEAAQLRVASHGVGFERLPGCTGASPIAPIGSDGPELGDEGAATDAGWFLRSPPTARS
jgi:hypothetical protein